MGPQKPRAAPPKPPTAEPVNKEEEEEETNTAAAEAVPAATEQPTSRARQVLFEARQAALRQQHDLEVRHTTQVPPFPPAIHLLRFSPIDASLLCSFDAVLPGASVAVYVGLLAGSYWLAVEGGSATKRGADGGGNGGSGADSIGARG